MEQSNRVYNNATGGFSTRPTKADPTGMHCAITGEQYRRDGEAGDGTPSAWGLKHYKTGKLTRVRTSRAEVRAIRKPTERVVAIWI